MSTSPDPALDRARTEAYRRGLTPEQGETLYRTGKTPQQLAAEAEQRKREQQEDIQTFKQAQAQARAQGGELSRPTEVRRTQEPGGIIRTETRVATATPFDPRSDIQIYKDLRAQARAEGKVLAAPPTITRDPRTGEVLNIRAPVKERFSIGDLSFSFIDQQELRRAQAERTAAERFERQEGAADYPTFTPKGKGIYEGVESSGDISTFGAVDRGDKITTTEIRRQPASVSKMVREMSPTLGAKEQPPPPDDPLLGASNFAENILATLKTVGFTFGKAPAAFFGGKDSAQAWYDIEFEQAKFQREYKPETELELITAGIASGKSVFEGKPTAEPFAEAFKTFSKAPAYYTGSLLASSALFFIPSTKFVALARGGAKAVTAVGYARAAKPIAATFTKTFGQPGFGEIAASLERLGYLGKRPGPVTGMTKQIKTSIDPELVRLERGFTEDIKSFSVGKELTTLERDFGLDIERIAAMRTRLPGLPQFGQVFEPVTTKAREVGELAAVPFRAIGDFARLAAGDIADFGGVAGGVVGFPFRLGRDVTSRGLDIASLTGQRVKATVEPFAYLRPNVERIKAAVDVGIVQPFRPLPYTEPFFTGAASARAFGADARFAGGVLNLGLDPYRAGGRRIRNFFEESIATFEVDFMRFTPEGRAARAGGDILKALEQGEILGLQRPAKGKAIFDIGTEDASSLFQSGLIDVRKGKFSLITREALPAEQREALKGIAKVEGIFEAETKGRKDLTPFGEIRDETIRELLPKTTKAERLPIFRGIELGSSVDDFIQTFSRVPRAAKAPKRVADVITYDIADIERYAAALQGPEDVLRLSRSDIAKALGLPEKRTRLFDIGQPASARIGKTSRTPLEGAAAFNFDRELQSSSKAIDSYVKAAVGIEQRKGAGFLGLGGGGFAARETLGFGGATGAGRRRRREESIIADIETVAYPKTGARLLDRLENLTGSRSDSTLKNMLDNLNRIGTRSQGRVSTAARTRPDIIQTPFTGVRQESITRTGQQTDQVTMQLLRQLTGQTTSSRTTTKLKPPTFTPPFSLDLGIVPLTPKTRKRKGKIKARPRSARVSTPLALLGTASGFAREFERIYGRLY